MDIIEKKIEHNIINDTDTHTIDKNDTIFSKVYLKKDHLLVNHIVV